MYKHVIGHGCTKAMPSSDFSFSNARPFSPRTMSNPLGNPYDPQPSELLLGLKPHSRSISTHKHSQDIHN